MCRATEFGVTYEINPWMSKDRQPNRAAAVDQQAAIVETLRGLGHIIEFVEPGSSLPDMCFTANAGVVKDKQVFLANLPAERQPEIPLYRSWFESQGYTAFQTEHRFGGGGDALWCGNRIIAGYGPVTRRSTDIAVHDELRQYFDVEVVSLQVTDPRFYDLDMSVAILSPTLIGYCADVLDAESIAKLTNLPGVEAFEVSMDDALAFGCNLISDCQNVLISNQAHGLIDELTKRGFNVLPHNISQFMLAGGGVRCLALNLPS